MFRCVILCFLYATAYQMFGLDTLQINGVHQTSISKPYLKYNSTNLIHEKWQTVNNDNTVLKPLNYFHAEALFKTNSTTPLVFEWPDNKIEELEAYITTSNGDTISKIHFNANKGFVNRLFVKNQVIILYNPDTIQTYKISYKIFSHHPAYVICWARNIDSIFNRFLKEYSWYGMFTGMIFIVFCLNMLLYLLLRSNTFLWYGLYTMSLGLFHWSYIGIGFQWFWPSLTLWNRYGYVFSSFLMISFQFVYFKYYIKNLYKINKWYILSVILFRFVILTVTVFNTTVNEWYFLIDFLTFAYLFFLLYKIKLYTTLHGKLFIASVGLLLMSYLIFTLAYYHLINSSFWAYNSIAMGGAIELLLGLIALALRFKFLSDEKNILQRSEIVSLKSITSLKEQVLEETREKERIQKEINKDLEIKIQERTKEIAQKNDKLEELNKKLLDMSSQLDKQNHSLNQTLAGDRLKLMWGKNINFVEFQQTFNSQKHIFRFISELKWGETFNCKKCNYHEWQEGTTFMSRKCTQCKYDESVTAHTLFHGVKFPIVKALYISLHTVNHRDSLPIKQMASEIDLRDATVWAFRKKTMDKLKSLKTNKGDVLKNLLID